MSNEPYPHPLHRIDFKIEQPPGRLLWMINRIPTWMFKLGMSKWLGKRFVMIVHRGRKSGKLNTVILEWADGDPDSGRVVYVSAYGKSQWYRNLEQAPAVKLITNGKTFLTPRHEFLGPEETEKAVAGYFKRYPGIANFLAKRKQYPYPGPIGTHVGAPIGVAFYLRDPV